MPNNKQMPGTFSTSPAFIQLLLNRSGFRNDNGIDCCGINGFDNLFLDYLLLIGALAGIDGKTHDGHYGKNHNLLHSQFFFNNYSQTNFPM